MVPRLVLLHVFAGLLIVSQTASAAEPLAPEKRFAIIVAVKNYKAPTPSLDLAYEDAAKLQGVLKRRGYSEQLLITDSPHGAPAGAVVAADTADHLVGVVKSAIHSAHNSGVTHLVFTFIGHGATVNGRDSLLPANFNRREEWSYLSLPNLFGLLTRPEDALKGSIDHVAVLLDISGLDVLGPLEGTVLPVLDEGKTLTVLNASAPRKVSLGLMNRSAPPLDFRGSLFVDQCVRALDRGGFKTWLEFVREVRARVNEVSARIARTFAVLKLPVDYRQNPQVSFSDPVTAVPSLQSLFPGIETAREKAPR